MAAFDPNEYFRSRYQGSELPKQESITQAMEEKLAGLKEYQLSVNKNSVQMLRQQAINQGRTWGEFSKDVGLSAVQGLDTLAKLPALAYDKATTGNFYGPETQAISKMSDEREKLKSAFAQASGQQKAVVAKEAGEAAKAYVGDGALGTAAQVAAEFGSAFWEAAKDPASIPDFLAQQAAQLGVMGKVGRIAEVGAQSAAKALPKLAATKAGQIALEKSSTAAAVGAGSVLQGVDVGSDTMQRLMSLPDEVWAQNPEYLTMAAQMGPDAAKQSMSSDLASKATLKAGAASLLTAALPGGTAIEKALVGKKTNGIAAVPKAFAGEAGQEGIEEGTGKLFGNQGVQAIDAKQDLFEGVGAAAGQGSFMGGIMGGGISAAKTGLEAAARPAKTKSSEADKVPGMREAQDAAIATGDVTPLTDPSLPTYNPERAIAALIGNANLPGVTDDIRQANLAKADEIVGTLKTKREELLSRQTYSTVEGLTQRLAQLQTQQAQATTPAETQKLAADIAETQGFLTKERADKSAPKYAKKLANELVTLEEEIARVSAVRGRLNLNVQSAINLSAQIEALNTINEANDPAVASASTDAASKIINLAMQAPELLDPVKADELANNAANALTAPQRSFLRQFSAARIAQNQLMNAGKVSRQIYQGGKGNLGIKDYQERMQKALTLGNTEQAQKQLDGLASFEADHLAKAKVAEQAIAMGQGVQIVKESGQWKVGDGSLTTEQLELNGGLAIVSRGLVQSIRQEADALTKSLAELQAAYDLKFNAGASNVQNQSQQRQGAQVQSKAAAAKNAAPAGTGTTRQAQGVPAATGADGAAKAVGVVEATGSELKSTAVDEETRVSSVNTVSTESTQSTEKTEATGVNNQSNSQNSTAELTAADPAADIAEVDQGQQETSAVEAGTLSAIQQTSPEGSAHGDKKLGDFFTQSIGKDTDGSKRPLVAVKDFMSAVAAGTATIQQYLKDQNLGGGAKILAWAKFVEKAAQWAPLVARNLKAISNTKFNYSDPMRYLIQTLSVNGKSAADVEENVKTASSAAVFSYVADQASRSAQNDDKAINKTLNHRPDAPVSTAAKAALTDVGVYQSQVIDSLGSAVIDALGLKLDINAPKDMLAKMQVSLGGHALKLMEDRGLLVRSSLTNGEINKLRNEDLFGGSEAENRAEEPNSVSDNVKGHHFFQLARNSAGQLVGEAKDIAEAIKGSQSLIQNLFGIEPSQTFPSLTPLKTVQQRSDTGMGLPGFIKKVFKLNQTRPWKVNKDPLKVLSFFSEAEGMEMAGVEMSDAHIHKRNKNSKRAKSDGLAREFRNFMGFVGELATGEKAMDQEFFLSQEMWKQQRSGYKTNAVNPNTSKIVRWLIAPDSWRTDIDRNNETQLQSFMLRASEGFGIKPEKADSQKSVDALSSLMGTPAMQAAVKALQTVLFSEGASLSAEQQTAVKTAVQAGGQKLHTLASLIAYARYQQAVDTKEATFTTNLMGEVDGVSNGSILNSIMYGAAASAEQLNSLLEKGGIYTLGSKFRQYNLWRGTPGHQDIYESNAQDLHAYVSALPAETRAVTGAIWATAGSPINAALEATKDGRDLLKGPINPLNYGGGFKSIIGKMAYDYVDSLYEKMESFSRKGADQATINEFVRNVNVLLDAKQAPQMPAGRPIAFYLGYTLSKAQEAALRNAYADTIGFATKEVVGRNFKPFLDRSKLVTQTVNLTYGLYEAVYNASRQAMIKEMGIPVVKGEPIHDLSTAQEAELAERLKSILPVMHTAMSKDEGNINNGILLAKKSRKQNNAAPYKVEVGFGAKLKNNASQLSASGRSVSQDAPGVIAISGTTHALDSAMSHEAQEANHVVNNHDAVGAGINTLGDSAQSLNKSTWSKTLNYSPLNEAHDALMRVVQGIVAMDQRGELTPEMKAAIKESLAELAKKTRGSKVKSLVDTVAFQVFNEALEANKIKLSAMSQWAVVDQYAMDGGSYKVTEADRKEAQDKLDTLSPVRAKADLQALNEFALALFGSEPVSAAPPAAVAAAPVKKAETNNTSPFGPLGTPKVAPDADLVAFFEANPEASFQRVLQGLLRKVGKDGSIPNQAFNMMLIKTLAKLVNPDFKVKYITSSTPADMPLGVMTGARGWTSIAGNLQEIYVLSPEFVDSGLTPEVLIHELVHAALQSVLARSDAAVQPFVEELNTLLDLSRTYLQQNGLSSKFGPAVASIDELVSWGMTNKAFQQEVLAKVQLQSRTLGKITNALQAFVATLSRLLGFKDVASANGLGVLIANVSALFDQVAKTQAAERSQTNGVTNLAMASPQAVLNTYSTQDLHDALDEGKISPAFSAQIRGVLGSIVEKLHGPYGSFKAGLMKDQALSGLDVWLKSLNTGAAPFASEALSSLFVISNQEAFAIEQVEATVRAALNANEAFSKSAYTELAKLHSEMEKRISVTDFLSGGLPPTPAELAKAQALYDFIFKVGAGPGQRSNYLARFAAMGMAHEGFNKLLQVATQRSGAPASQSFADRLQGLFEKILAFWQTAITKTYAGQPADQKLTALVDQLVDIEAKRRYVLANPKRNNFQESVEQGVRNATEAVRSKVSKAAGSSFIQNNKNPVVRAAGGLVRTIADDQVDFFMDNLRTMRNSAFKGKLGVIASALGELKGAAPLLQALLRQSKANEGKRKDLITDAAKAARNAFANQGKDLSEAANAAISAVFLRTGAHYLKAHFSMAEMADLLGNKTALNKAVATFEAKLNGFGNAKYYFINQANALGLQKATSAVATGFEMTNAHNIANMYGTAYQGKLTVQQTQEATAAIEVLTALYALGYSSTAHLSEASQVLSAENQRTDGNGVEFVMKLHQQLEAESLQRLFKGRPELMMHGYVPEIYDPNVDIQTANNAEGKELLALGYRKGPQLAPDKADPDRTVQHIYIRDGGGLNPRVTGIVSWKGMNAKGSQQHSGYLNTNTYNGAQNASFNADIMANRSQAIADMFKPGARPDLSQVKANHMLPVLNERGEVVNWRYVMSEATKDALLKRDNRFDQLLGSLAGSIYDKETSREQNKTAIQALKDQYDLDYQKNPEAYVEVGERVLDKEMKEIWDLLPEASKADARAVWGTNSMMVRNDALDIMFGYRKKSLADSFEKDPQLRNQLEKVFVGVIEMLMSQSGRAFKGMTPQQAQDFAKQAAYRISKGERIWQEVVGEVKDIVVVKTGLVMLGNIYSNMTLLAMNGVPLKDMLHHHLVALKGANAYRRDNDELAQLKLLRDTGYMQGQDQDITRRIIKLEDAIARNPVKELIDAGLMPTIVEDVANDEDIYSYKSDFARKAQKYTDKLNPKVLNAAKVVYMAHDTQLYQGLFRITQLSDFVARYTLYQHHIAKANPLSKADAVQEASDAFVNYDIPMHRTLQHLDDLGLLPFTKYFLRIQKVLGKLFKEQPARVLSTLAIGQFMDLGPIVLESSMWGRIGNNPLDLGALKLPGVLDDLATVNATMSLFK